MSNKLELDITGNPFIDSGIFALSTKLEKDICDITVDDLRNESKFISNLYLEESWQKNMHSIFPNSKLVNTAVKGNRYEKYLELLNDFINTIPEIQSEGSCMGCGRREANDHFFKSMIPLTGSGSLINFFSFANSGAEYCPLCILLIQFSPLVMYRCKEPKSKNKISKDFILIHSDSQKVMKFWAKKAIDDINLQVASGEFTGCYNQGITRPTNAIFNIISQVISSGRKWRGENPSFNFYYFTNYNQTPDLEIFTLPTSVFKFLTEIPRDDWSNWSFIVKKSYMGVKWNKVENENDYKNYPNKVYINLLEKKSILRSFYTSKFKKTYCTWKLVKSYMKEVWNMDEKRIDVIKDVGDRLSDYIKNNDNVKTLSSLENASNYNNFRNILRKILKNKILTGDGELLFTFDEYVSKLFPDGNMTWRETQDLLLFRIYENLHEWLIDNEYVDEISDNKLLEED